LSNAANPEFPGGYPVVFADPVTYVPLAKRFKFFADGAWHCASAIPHHEFASVEFEPADMVPHDGSPNECTSREMDHQRDAASLVPVLDRDGSDDCISRKAQRTNILRGSSDASLEIEITPEMIEAGESAVLARIIMNDVSGLLSASGLAKEVFRAMDNARNSMRSQPSP